MGPINISLVFFVLTFILCWAGAAQAHQQMTVNMGAMIFLNYFRESSVIDELVSQTGSIL